jgi:hypothetical protein
MRIDGEFFKFLDPGQTTEILDLSSGERTIEICARDKLYNFNSRRVTFNVDSDPPLFTYDIQFDPVDLNNSYIDLIFWEPVNRSSLDLHAPIFDWEEAWINFTHLRIYITGGLRYNENISFVLTIDDIHGNEASIYRTERTPSGPDIPEDQYGRIYVRIEGPWVPDSKLVTIYIDGIVVLRAFLPFDDLIDKIEPGSHTLRIEVEGASTFEASFNVLANETEDLGTITLEKEGNSADHLVLGLLISGLVIGVIFVAIYIFIRRRGTQYTEE